MNNNIIYDFETLSQDRYRGVVVSLAVLTFDPYRFTSIHEKYTFEELVNETKFVKFDVEQQTKHYGRKIQKSTLEWWKEQGEDAIAKIKPSPDDVSISTLPNWWKENTPDYIEKAWTRNNTFDPVILDFIYEQFADQNDKPHNWWSIRDTRSYIEGLSFGSNLKNNFIPEGIENKITKHDPTHDVALDVMRIQTLAEALYIPF